MDNGRVATDPFKLPTALRTLRDALLADLKVKDAATLATEGGRATASANVRAALEQLQTLLRDEYNFVQGLGSFAITDADRIGLFTAFGKHHSLARRAGISSRNR